MDFFIFLLLIIQASLCLSWKIKSFVRMSSDIPAFHPAPMKEQIFCNVELNGDNLEAVGFDMDFTLAQYNEDFDLLAFEGAKRKLYENLGYPKEVLNFEYSYDKFRRGLIIDKQRGNIIKIDRHKYVRRVYHGLTEMTAKQRKSVYNNQVTSFTESNYVNIDTIFLLIDALLFTSLVDFKDKNPDLVNKSYEAIYKDVRQSVDLCHKDGVIKDTVMENPSKYIIYDKMTVPMLKQIKEAGKKVFLLTNSMWDYTNEVMEYLVHGGGEYKDIEWHDLFDLIIVGACKPSFLTSDYLSFFRVDRQGMLHNIEDKEGIAEFIKDSSVAGDGTVAMMAGGGKVFQGGHWQDLQRILDVSFGDRILYVGDHMYADILRSKRTLGWRTCLIIPELENELEVAQRESELGEEVRRSRQLQYDLDEYLDYLREKLKLGSDVKQQLIEAELKAEELKKTVSRITEVYNRRFNPFWGQLFKAGHHDSRFAKQVMEYACLYTSKATNLAFVSPNRPFRPVQDFMPHDQVLFDSEYLALKLATAAEKPI